MTEQGRPAADIPISDTIHRLLGHTVDSFQGRLDLLRIELAEERDRLGHRIVRGSAAGLLVFLTCQMLFTLVIALVWDTRWRVPTIAGMAVAVLIAALLTIRAYKMLTASTVFEATVTQFSKDARAIGGQT